MKSPNAHDSRETWLREATVELRPYYASVGYPLPENIRFAIAFPSTGRNGNRLGECWHFSTSADGTFEIIIRADQSDPLEVLGVLAHELVHAVLPADAGHGKLFRHAAIRIGLEGPMRHAMPNTMLREKLTTITARLGPLPHAKLNIALGRTGQPADRARKQGTRLLRVECPAPGCDYNLRGVKRWVVDVQPPPCPFGHGKLIVILPTGDGADATPSDGP
jgi:hypothetical protein